MQFDSVKDSGERQIFDTGSKRDTQQGKGRPDLIPVIALKRLAKHYENGAVKYGDRNWEKGQPLSRYYASAQRHLWDWFSGDYSEDHLSAVVWNVFCIIHHIEYIRAGNLPSDLDDIGAIQAIEKHTEQIDTCGVCGGTGGNDGFCLRCNGSGHIPDNQCKTCNGNRTIECPECNGSNKVYNNRFEGYTTCDYCDGKCFIPCKECT